MEQKYAELQDIAIRWLHSRHCDTFAKEAPWNGETVDAIGMKYINYRKVDSIIYAVDAKASRSADVDRAHPQFNSRTEIFLLAGADANLAFKASRESGKARTPGFDR